MGKVGSPVVRQCYMYHCPRRTCPFKTRVVNRMKEHYRRAHTSSLPYNLLMAYAVLNGT